MKAMMVMVIPVLLGVVYAPVVLAQSAPAKKWAFEVISIKPFTAEDRRTGTKTEPDGRLSFRGPVYQLIASAYGVPFQSPRLSGGPDWTRSEGYSIEAVP